MSSSNLTMRTNGNPQHDHKLNDVNIDKHLQPLSASIISQRTINPIRRIVDCLKVPQDTGGRSVIPLSLGDPSVFGNLHPPASAIDALVDVVRSNKSNGYAPSSGVLQARTAIAKRFSTPLSKLKPTDVTVCSGASGALAIAIQAVANAGDNILLPQPGFALYSTICGHDAIETRFYRLVPDRSWEADLEHLESLVDNRTRAILVNNPGNPTGSVYSAEHLNAILDIAHKFGLPIIADEIYADMVFSTPEQPRRFYALGELSVNVPIITIGGIAKQYVVPGWRVGWIVLHDRHDRFTQVRHAIESLSQLIIGANTLVQAIIPDLLLRTPDSYYTQLMSALHDQASVLIDGLRRIQALKVVIPQGAMYVMAKVMVEQLRGIADDSEFCQKLLAEECVILLPGTCFNAPNYVRFVFCAPTHILQDAISRIDRFCSRHMLTSSEYENVTTHLSEKNEKNKPNDILAYCAENEC